MILVIGHAYQFLLTMPKLKLQENTFKQIDNVALSLLNRNNHFYQSSNSGLSLSREHVNLITLSEEVLPS